MSTTRDHRRALRRIYRETEANARRTQKDRVAKALAVLVGADLTIRALPRFRATLERAAKTATNRHETQFSRMFRNVTNETVSYLESQASRTAGKTVRVKTVAGVSKRLQNRAVGGKTLTQRVQLLSRAETDQSRLRVLSGALRGETAGDVVASMEKLALGPSKKAGAMFRAERLARSEQTRYAANLTVEVSRKLEKENGLIAIYTYHTQEDDRVRDEHDALNGVEFVDDDFVGLVSYQPVSEALSALSEPNCRCWLSVEFLPLG